MSQTDDCLLAAAPRTPRLPLFVKMLPVILLAACFGVPSIYYYRVLTDNIGEFQHTMRVIDLDLDGDLDVIQHNLRQESALTGFGGVTLWLNEGRGQFAPEQLEKGGGWSSDVADADQDGDIDLFVYAGYQMNMLLNQGGIQAGTVGDLGPLQVVTGPALQQQYGTVLVGDLSGDGLTDGLIVGSCGPIHRDIIGGICPKYARVWISEWTDNGYLYRQWHDLEPLIGTAVQAASLGDMDGDGDLDLIALLAPFPEQSGPAGRLLLNDGTGHFSDSGIRLGPDRGTAVAVADLEGDGDLDVLLGGEEAAYLYQNMTSPPGEAKLALSLLRAFAGTTDSVSLADMNGDGSIDVLLSGRGRSRIWLNNGGEEFTYLRDFRVGNRDAVAAADFDGDGRTDIFIGRYADQYRLWLSQPDGSFLKVH